LVDTEKFRHLSQFTGIYNNNHTFLVTNFQNASHHNNARHDNYMTTGETKQSVGKNPPCICHMILLLVRFVFIYTIDWRYSVHGWNWRKSYKCLSFLCTCV